MMFESFLKEKERPLESLPRADVVVVLSREMKKPVRTKSGEAGIEPDVDAKMRSVAALELLERGIADRILFAGGVAKKFPKDKSRAKVMKDFLISCGVPENKIMTEDESQNTTENVNGVLDILEKEGIKRILVETSEYHLPRAKQLFGNLLEKRGLKLEEADFIAAEDILLERSPHYKELVSHFSFPSSLAKSPGHAVATGVRELLRRVLIFIDSDDKLATFFARKIRTPKQK